MVRTFIAFSQRALAYALALIVVLGITLGGLVTVCGVPSASASAAWTGTDGFGPLVAIPGGPAGGGYLGAVSCTGPGDCTAVGTSDQPPGSLDEQPLYVTESDGTWGTPTLLAGAGSLGAVSCTSAGDCTAVGDTPGPGPFGPFYVTESNGTWGTPAGMPSPAPYSTVQGVSCTSAGNCIAVGQAGDNKPYYVHESAGTWGAPTEIPLTVDGDLDAVSCPGPGDCTAVGGDNKGQPFYVAQSAGTWGTPTEIPVTGVGGGFQGVSCTSAGDCTAVGYDNGQPFYAIETDGTWGTPTEIPAPAGGSFIGVSCTTAVDCAAVGNTSSSSSPLVPLYAVESDGTWGPATEATPSNGAMESVSCTGAAYCTAVALDNSSQLLYANSADEQAPAITSPASASTRMRSPFSFTVTTTGAPTPAITEKGALPAGVTFTDNGNGTASLKGTARLGTRGRYPITITASNGIGKPSIQPFTLTVTAATSKPVITSAASSTATVGTRFKFTVTATGYPLPKITESGSLPLGLKFADTGNGTAIIAGCPLRAAVGIHRLKLTATNSAGTTHQKFTLHVVKAPGTRTQPHTRCFRKCRR